MTTIELEHLKERFVNAFATNQNNLLHERARRPKNLATLEIDINARMDELTILYADLFWISVSRALETLLDSSMKKQHIAEETKE